MKQKTNRLHFSTRTLAMVLSIVMLIGSIATGSMLNTFAAYMKDDGSNESASVADDAASADQQMNDAVQSGAKSVSDCASAAFFSDEVNGFEDYENDFVRSFKDDLATTGAKSDLAETGWSNDEVRLAGTFNSWSTSNNKARDFSGDVGYIDVTFATAGSFQCKIVTVTSGGTTTWWGVDKNTTSPTLDTSGNSSYGLTSSDGDAKNLTLSNVQAGDYTFKVWYTDQDKWKIQVVSRPSAPTWTVAGSSTALFGASTWSYTNTDNDMTTTDDTNYVWSKKNVSLTAGSFEFKVFKDHNNSEAYPDSNKQVTVSATGNYDVTITFNSSTHAINVTLDRVYDVAISAGTGGSVSPSGTQTGVSSTNGLAVTATASTGYSFASWTKTNVTTTTETRETTVKPTASGAELVANFSKNSYEVTYGSAANGTFTVTKQLDGSSVASGTSLEYQTGLTVLCTPNKGYRVKSVKYNDTSIIAVSTNTYSFNVPAAITTITVEFEAKPYAISGSAGAGGTMKVTDSASSTTNLTQWNIGATRYLRATPNAAYNFEKFVVTYATGDTETFTTNDVDISESLTANKITSGDEGAISVVAYFTKKPTYKVTVKTSSLAYGSASANVSEAYQGQSVTITATENTGTFNKWTVTSGTVSSVNNSTTNPLTFTMGSTDLVITANYDAYTGGTSEYYYNSYDSANGGIKSGAPYGEPLVNTKINGSVYSYIHVTGRSETDQTFTISHYTPATTGTVYFQRPDTWSQHDKWSNWADQYAVFYAYDGNILVGYSWVKMTSNDTWDSCQLFETTIPFGARYVQFYDDWDQSGYKAHTVMIDLTTTGTKNRFWVSSSDGYEKPVGMGDITYNNNPVSQGMHEYFKDDSGISYSNSFGTKGFGDLTVGNHKYAKPNENLSSTTGYYVLLLYANTPYTFNNTTYTPTKNTVIWMDTLPSTIVDDTPTVDIYAKNGTLRDSTFNRFTNLANTDFVDYFEYTEILDSGVYTYTSVDEYNASGLHTPIVVNNNVTGSYDSNYATMTNVPIGAKIKLKTTLSNDATVAGSFTNKNGVAQKFRDTHYLKAYSFNGATYELHEPNNDGEYDEIWTVRDVNTKKTSGGSPTNLMKDGRAIEVTPIYYMKDNSNCKTFYIDGYDGTVQGQWGNMLSVYPYYEGKSNSANAFGGYPGQPMLFWGGKYQMEIPLTDNGTSTGATVKGLTLHNGFWDLLHRSLDNVCDKHAQTYDYDDFYKLYKEKNPDTIIFDFKYRTTKDNFNDGYDYYSYDDAYPTASAATYAGSGYNGVELVTDYFGRQVDLFGTLIPDGTGKSDYDTTHTQDKELLIVSTGYKDTYVGEYATLWAVYAPQSDIPEDSDDTAGKFIGYISSSMLYLKDLDRLSQYTGGTDTAPGKMSWDVNLETYRHLKEYYTGVPALISYEKEIYNDSKDKANRSDGKWYYSNKNDQISANIQVQYCDVDTDVITKPDKALNDNVWTTDDFTGEGLGGETNVGDDTGCSAYFTNTSPYLKGKTESGKQFADSSKKFTFEAVPSGQYMFVNWVRYSNGKYYEVSEKEVAESPMSSNDTYIARFVKTRSGTLKISHVVETNSTYTGTGTPSVTVTVTNGSTQVFTETRDDGTAIDISRFMNTKYAGYKIDISLSTSPDEDSTLYEITNGSGISEYDGALSGNTATVAQFTVYDALEEEATAVSTLRYVSHLTTINYTYNYKIKYTYTSRFWGEQYFEKSGTLVSTDAEQMTNITGKKGSARLTESFIENQTPYEKNFRETINWNYTYDAVGDAAAMTNSASLTGENTYTINVTVDSANTVNDKVVADILLPYPHDPIAGDYAAKTVVAHKSENDDSTKYDEYIYDESQEAVPVQAQVYKLFTTDGSVPASGDSIQPSDIDHLVLAAPYVWKNPAKRYVKGEVTRYFTGTYFTANGKHYYYGDVPADDPIGYKVEDTEAFTNTWHDKPYTMSVIDTATNELYSFKENGANGQYTRHTWEDTVDGFYMYDNAGNLTGTKKYFTRWDIYSAFDGSYVASSYNRYFNYTGYENYRVKAIYNSDSPNPAVETNLHSVPTITYLGDTRNQWTAGGQGTAGDVYNNAASGGDKLLHDFAISFDYYEDEIRLIENAANGGRDIKIGMLIEKLGTLDSTGEDKILEASYYANKYKNTYDPSAIKDYFEGRKNSTDLKSALGAIAIANSKIGANVENWGNLFTSTTGNIGNGNTGIHPIDNMNRLQWYYTYTNTKQLDGSIGATNNANFVYRASAYIIDAGEATASSVPVYFTLYDSASR